MDTPISLAITTPLDEADLAERFEELRPTADALARSAGLLRRITRRLAAPDGYEALKKVQKDLAALSGLELSPGSVVGDARTAAAAVEQWLSAEWERRASTFIAEMVEYLRQRDVDVEVRGNEVVALPLTIHIDAEQDRAALLYAGEAVVERLPLRAERIYDRWVKAQEQLERRGTPPESFADDLIAACADVRRLKEASSATRLRLSDVHFQLFVRRQTAQVRQDPRKGRVKEYPRYQFAWDLAALMQACEWLDRGSRGRLEIRDATESAARSRTASVHCVVDREPRAFADVRVS